MAGFDDLASAPTAAKALAPPPAPPAAPEKPAAPGMVEKMIGSFGAGVKDAAAKNRALDAETMKMSPPKLEMPPKPEFKETSPIDAWGSIAMVFAGLASFKARQHASTAMNAAAEALKGIQNKDKETYDRAFKQWEVETKNAIDLANFQQRAYEDLLRHNEHRESMNLEIGKSLDAAEEAKFRTLTVAMQDPGMWQAYERNGIAGAADFQKQRERQTQEFELQKMKMSATGQKAAQALLMSQVVQSDAWKNAKTAEEKMNVLVDAGVDSTHILLAMAKMDAQKTTEANREALKREEMGQKAEQFDKTFGLKSREADDKTRLAEAGLGLKRDEFEQKKTEFGVKTDMKKAEDAFKELEHADKMKAEQAKIDARKAEDDKKLEFLREKLKADTETKQAALEQRAKEAFDKVALGKATLEEKAINDRENLKLKSYKIGESHEEFQQRMELERDKLKLNEKKDEDRKAEFREKMDLELKKFDEKKAVDAERIGVSKAKLESAEKAGSAKAHSLAPEEIEDLAQQMAHLKIPMASNYLAARNPSWGEANRRAFQIAKENGAKDFSAQSYPALMAQRKDAGSGQASKGIRYLSVANKHLEAMEAAVMALPNDTDLKGLTKVFNFVSNQVNDSNLAAEQVDGQIVANEVAKAISGAGNLTGEEREKLNSMFDPARGKASILGIIHHARELLGGQAGGYVHQFAHYATQAGISSADITGMDPEAAKSFFINPDTGETDAALVKWDRDRIAAVLEGKPLPPRPGSEAPKAAAPAEGGWKFQPTHTMPDGRKIGLNKDGTGYVYEDGSPVEGQ